jgi:hypothetical protein
MKKLFLMVMLILSYVVTKSQDLTFDSVKVISPYWGAEIRTFTADNWSNCGSSNTNFVSGQTGKALYFPINIVNMGTNPAYFGKLGVNGIVKNSCYANTTTQPTDFLDIPNFVTAYLLDSCGNVLNSNRKTCWNIQNNYSYAVGKYNGVWYYFTNYFGLNVTTGNDPNPTKDWLESLCGTIDTNIAFIGYDQLTNWTDNCQTCDSLLLFPNYGSDEPKFAEGNVIQLPLNFPAGNYYLKLEGNFSQYEVSNCYPNTITFPFTYSGSDGFVTFQSQDHSCTSPVAPNDPANVTSQVNNGIVLVVWTYPNYPQNLTGFEVTPIYVQGNTERILTARKVFSTNISTVFDAAQLRNDAIALGAGNGPAKFKFVVKAVNGTVYSNEVKTRQSLNIK